MTGRHIDDATLHTWIDLVRLGGYWSGAELRDQIYPNYAAESIRDRLLRLHANGMVHMRWNATSNKREYGVTTKCAAPPGYESYLGADCPPTPILPKLKRGVTRDSIDRDTRIAPAPRYDRMRAPVLTSPPAAPLRAGANDHKRIASFGVHC